MKIFSLIKPSYARVFSQYKIRADFAAVEGVDDFCDMIVEGEWQTQSCTIKGQTHSVALIPPLRIDLGSHCNQMAEVTWSYAGYDFIWSESARRKAKLAMELFDAREVRTVERPEFANDQLISEFEASQFQWLVPRKSIRIDAEANRLKKEIECRSCDLFRYEFKVSNLRFPLEFIDRFDIFGTSAWPLVGITYATEEAAAYLSDANIDNLGFLEAGVAV